MVNKLFLLLLMIYASSFCIAQKGQSKRTLLFVGAHPDDEAAISEVLHKYARLGNRVYVIIAIDSESL